MSTLRTSNLIHGSSAVSNVVLDTQGRASFGPDGPNGRAALYVNPQNNRVGVNNESPSATLDVDGAINTTGNLTVGGTLNLTGAFTSNVINAGSGTAAAPSVSVGTTDNGLYSPGTDQVAISTNGTGRLFVDSSGNVGIGTSSPSARLNIETNAADAAKLRLSFDSTRYYDIFRKSSDGTGLLHFYGSQSSFTGYVFGGVDGERMRIDSSGNVGIGTSSPITRLHVNSGTTDLAGILESSDANVFLAFKDGSTSGNQQVQIGAVTNNLVAYAGGSERLRIDSSGDVEIGSGKYLTWVASPGGTHRGRIKCDSGDSIVFENTSGNTERMRIDSSGRLLVGTSSASSNDGVLVVQGYAGATASAGTLDLVRGNNVTAGTQGLGTINFGHSQYQGASIDAVSEAGWTEGSSHPARLVFSTSASGASSPTERMTIKEDGVVAVGAGDSPNNERFFASAGVSGAAAFRVGPTSGTFAAVVFYDGVNTDCGSIDINTTANTTAYTTSSDYRLKQDVQPLTNSIDRILQLTPCEWNWVKSPETRGEGFIAHEAQVVVPECATGTKDEVDDEGNPVYQGIDQAKLVPLLTAALQEAVAKIENLEQRLSDAGIA